MLSSYTISLGKTKYPSQIKVDGAKAYQNILPELYGWKEISGHFGDALLNVVEVVSKDPKFDRYYKNKKEGYFQTELSRMFGICGSKDSDFVVLDKEAVIGYDNQVEKDHLYGDIRDKYKIFQGNISKANEKRYGKNLQKKPIGNELDFFCIR